MKTVSILSPDMEIARAIILRHGWNTTSYQILNPGLQRWYSSRHDALVGYVNAAGTRVVAGAPVCELQHLNDVVAEFQTDAEQEHQHVCYFAVEARLQSVIGRQPGYATVALGAQPGWHPESWATIINDHVSLRAQLHRAQNKGVVVREWTSEHAEHSPALHQCLQAWLASRGLPTLRFLVEPHTLSVLMDRHIFVATQDEAVVGFVVISPIAVGSGWLIEQFIRHPLAPNGTAELMIDTAVQWMAIHHAQYVTLGLVPLSRHIDTENPVSPLWIRMLFAWARAHGRRFYNFDGLDAFKAKFHPQWWEPVFAISNERRFSPQSLYAIAAAFTEGRPLHAITVGLAKAVRHEWRWMTGQ